MTVTPQLCNGGSLTGQPLWWDLGAIGLQPIDNGPPIVVKHHAVIDWDSLAAAQ
jgi:hypothetical protein